MKLQHKITGQLIEASQEFLDAHSDEYELFIHQEPSLDQLKLEKIDKLHASYQAQFDVYLAQYPDAEVATFEDKKREALAYIADNTSPTPIIDSIVAGYGSNKDEYIASVVAKVEFLAAHEGVMVAVRDAIKACTTQDELNQIQI